MNGTDDWLVMSEADLRRFWSKVVLPDASGKCWVWVGRRRPSGYGQFWLRGRSVQAHRAAYATFVGPIPAGLVLDHLVCDRPACVNPQHLKPCTDRENTMRDGSKSPAAALARQTHCLKGHPLSGDNLSPWHLQRGRRQCLICRRGWGRVASLTAEQLEHRREYKREWSARKRAEQKEGRP